MNRATIGLVVVRVPRGADRDWVDSACCEAAVSVSRGRSLAALWEVPHEWAQTAPVEAWVTRAILGPPEARPEDGEDGFAFFANLAVRCYRGTPFQLARTLCVVLFRKHGEPAYRRKADADAPVGSDLLDTGAFAFTRDIANNTWNIRDRSAEDEIIARLARLLCWSDEAVLEFVPEKHKRPTIRNRPSADLIGVAVKHPYRWRCPSTGAAQMDLLGDS